LILTYGIKVPFIQLLWWVVVLKLWNLFQLENKDEKK
jgi:hypothetical protein